MGKRKQVRATQQERAAELFAAGDRYREQEAWAQAAAHYQLAWAIAAEQDLAHADALRNGWYRTGTALMRVGRTAEAEPYLRRSLEVYRAAGKQSRRLPALLAIAELCAMLGEWPQLINALEELFALDEAFVAHVAQAPEFAAAREVPSVQHYLDRIIAAIHARRTDFSAEELPVFGCANCRDKGYSTDGHDWTLECSVCGKSFAYSGCSCDGCCGGTYAGFGGGRTVYQV